MRWLIDGYNVMHAGGRVGRQLGREGFDRARRRFLDDLAGAMGPDRAAGTTVVFDANLPPRDFPLETTYHGLRLVFALGDENADARIEWMIGQDPNPAQLTVVSSDRRIRLAAARRRARPMTAERFWDWIDDLRERPAGADGSRRAVPVSSPSRDPRDEMTSEERDLWLSTFRELGEDPETRQALAPHASLLTDAEIAEIQRQVDGEP
ncbi:MAG TPA: NYN domain-containing protein [Isosphaeraceae bacterium]|nr:NYN domain-containing protein [Isosphaeraceae bacterium]